VLAQHNPLLDAASHPGLASTTGEAIQKDPGFLASLWNDTKSERTTFCAAIAIPSPTGRDASGRLSRKNNGRGKIRGIDRIELDASALTRARATCAAARPLPQGVISPNSLPKGVIRCLTPN
jgi:hypothetical protein